MTKSRKVTYGDEVTPRRRIRVLGATTAVLSTIILSLVASPASATEPDPVMNKAIFNDPIGTVAEQNAIFIQLARLIDRVPADGEIQMTWYNFNFTDVTETPDTPDIVQRLIDAHRRGASVKIIVDQSQTVERPYQRLLPVLGSADTARSYIVHCADQFLDPPDLKRGCIGTRTISTVPAYNHNKFLTASKIVLNNGTTVSNVVFQASSNLTWWDGNEVYNNAVTFSDYITYQDYFTYFGDLAAKRYLPEGDNNYYWVGSSGTTYKAHFFPRHETAGTSVNDPATDTVVNILKSVSCRYYDNGWRQTDVRVVMFQFTRVEVAKQLVVLKAANCWVDVVVVDRPGNLSASVKTTLLDAKIQLTSCDFNVGPERDVRIHSKYMLIDGAYDDDIVPRVFTGSHNFTISALRQADETLLRIMGRGMHDDYLHNFWHIRDTCRANGGAIS